MRRPVVRHRHGPSGTMAMRKDRAPGRGGPASQQRKRQGKPATGTGRSEEHTSELQSLMRISYAVFCLKKNNRQDTRKDQTSTQHNSTQKYTYGKTSSAIVPQKHRQSLKSESAK